MNRGAEKLARLVTERGDLTRVAENVGADISTVARWITGERVPNARMRFAIEDWYGIGAREWDKEVEG